MRVEVDFDVCDGNALCMGAAPEVFQVDENGSLHVLTEEPRQEVWDDVRQAEMICPTQAISLADD